MFVYDFLLALPRSTYATPRQDTIAQQGHEIPLCCVRLVSRLSTMLLVAPYGVAPVARLLRS